MNWIFWAVLSAFFAGVTAVLAKLGVAGIDSNLATAIRTSVVLVFSWAIVLATNPGFSMVAISRRAWLFLTLSGIATGLSWLCYFRALQLGEASRVAPVDKLSEEERDLLNRLSEMDDITIDNSAESAI